MGRWDDTVDYIQRINSAQTPDEISRELLTITKSYGLTKIIAGTLPAPNLRPQQAKTNILLSDWPDDWMKHYVAQNYAYFDPILQATAEQPGSAFFWEDAERNYGQSERSRMVMAEAAEHGLSHGFAVPLVTVEGDIATASFGGEFIDMSPEAAGLVHLIGIFAVGKAFQLQAKQRRPFERLTPRERDVVLWAAEGKTDWEIGVILSIAESTVRSHIKSAMAKFFASNRTALVAEALRAGIIK